MLSLRAEKLPTHHLHFQQELTFSASDSRFNSLTTAAKASGFTPFSIRLASIDKVR